MNRAVKNRIQGITLIELLVSLAISSLIILMVAGLFLFSNKSVISFQKESFFNDQRLLFESSIRQKLMFMEKIIEAGPEVMEISTRTGSLVRIEMTSGDQVLIDAEPVLPEGFSVKNLNFAYYSTGRQDNTTFLGEVSDENENFHLDGNELTNINLVKLSYDFQHLEISRRYEMVFCFR